MDCTRAPLPRAKEQYKRNSSRCFLQILRESKSQRIVLIDVFGGVANKPTSKHAAEEFSWLLGHDQHTVIIQDRTVAGQITGSSVAIASSSQVLHDTIGASYSGQWSSRKKELDTTSSGHVINFGRNILVAPWDVNILFEQWQSTWMYSGLRLQIWGYTEAHK